MKNLSEELMTEQEFIARFKKHGFELYKTKALKPKLSAFYKMKGIANSIKMLAIFLTIAVALSACNATKITQSWVKDNCTEQHKLNPQGESFVYVKCENLHPTDKIKKVCPKSKACYSPSDAVIEIEAACGDSTFNVAKIVKAITNR